MTMAETGAMKKVEEVIAEGVRVTMEVSDATRVEVVAMAEMTVMTAPVEATLAEEEGVVVVGTQVVEVVKIGGMIIRPTVAEAMMEETTTTSRPGTMTSLVGNLVVSTTAAAEGEEVWEVNNSNIPPAHRTVAEDTAAQMTSQAQLNMRINMPAIQEILTCSAMCWAC